MEIKTNPLSIGSVTPNRQEDTMQYVALLLHELRNPLAGIILSLEMLESGAFRIDEETLKTHLGVIRRSTGRVKTLITEILNYPKAEKLPAVPCSMHQLLDELLEDAQDRIALKGITVKKQYSEEDVDLVLNPQKIKIAVNNIIINAIESMDAGKGELVLATKSRKDTFIVEIEDNGCGIDKVHLRHVFKPFYTSKPDGLGLGLTTTSDILQLNNVKVSVASEPGHGTRFILFFDKKMAYTGRREERNDAQHSL